MSYFSQSLNRIIERSFEGKQRSLAKASGFPTNELSRLTRELSTCTAEKLSRLTEGLSPEDGWDLVCAALRDHTPPEYRERVSMSLRGEADTGEARRWDTPQSSDEKGLESLSVDPEIREVLTYIMRKAEYDAEVVTALRLVHKWLNL